MAKGTGAKKEEKKPAKGAKKPAVKPTVKEEPAVVKKPAKTTKK